MERETLKITTPINNHVVVLKAWLIGREKREINSVFLKSVQIQAGMRSGSEPTMSGLKGIIMEDAENKMLETVIVSIDDSSERIVERVLDMHEKDYKFIIDKINEITTDKDFLDESQI